MPIGGGTFTVQNKTLPGAYINFVSMASAVTMGARGVVALPLELNWGPEKQVFSVTAGEYNQTAMDVLGYDPTSPELLLVREGLKRVSALQVYRVNSGGVKAKATVSGMIVTAKYGGIRGNDLAVGVEANGATVVDVVTYLEGVEMNRQTVTKDTGSSNLKSNAYITFGEVEALTVTAAVSLKDGTNGAVSATSYADCLTALEVESFNVLGYCGTDEAIKTLVIAFVKRLREDEGKKIVGVLYQATTADDIGIISVKNGVKLADGTVLSGDKAVSWVAGATASAQVNESLTNVPYDGAVDVDIKYTRSQYEGAIEAGEFVFYAEGNRVRVLSDVNSRTTFDNEIPADWASNRVVRVMDGWANDVAAIFGSRYLGAQTNSDTGRNLFKADLVSLGKDYEGLDAIANFLPDDIVVVQGKGKRDVAVSCALCPNDSMEKLYMTVSVN